MQQKVKIKIKAIYALTRFNEYWDFNLTLCLLALAITGKSWDLLFLVIVLANLFSLAFAFMINDIEDSEEDATDLKKFLRNPIANKTISKREGYLYTNIVMFASIFSYLYIALKSGNILPFIFGSLILIIDFFYSYRKFRLKKYPVLDLVTHSYMLAGGQFLVTYFAYQGILTPIALAGLLIVVFVSMYGELENELKDYAIDYRTGIFTSAVSFGKNLSKTLQLLFMGIVMLSIIYIIIVTSISINSILVILVIFLASFLYPIFRYLIFKNINNWKTDMNRAIIAVSNVLLIYYVVNKSS